MQLYPFNGHAIEDHPIDLTIVNEVEEIIGFVFRDKELLRQCFTLSSVSETKNNERLEFLGDAIIEMCVSEAIYHNSSAPEGPMTKVRQTFVSNAALKSAIERMDLAKYMRYVGTESNLGSKPIASLFEALVAGIYLEGGLEAARVFITEKLLAYESLPYINGTSNSQVNYKGLLQEYLQAKKLPMVKYSLLEKQGPDHAPTFLVEAASGDHKAIGKESSKSHAEMIAAKNLLEILEK